MSEDRVPYQPLAGATPERLVPVLQLPREELRRGVRNMLFELHQERLWKQGYAGEEERLAHIAFWEAVLGWIMEQEGDCVNLVGRAR